MPEDLKREGKIRAIGASSATPAELDAYRAAGTLAVCQPRYSLLDRRIEADVLPYCAAHAIATLVYSPLEQGLLTGRIGIDYRPAPGEFRGTLPWLRQSNRRRVLDLLSSWSDLTTRYRCSLAQLVIAWTLQQPGVTHALCGARTVAQVVDNAAAGDRVLTDDDLARMRRDAEALGEPLPA